METVNRLFTLQRNEAGRVAIIMRLANSFLVSPYVRPEDAQRIVCILLGKRIKKLVKQRDYQIRHGFTSGIVFEQQSAIRRLNYKLTASPKWNFKVLPKYLNALLPDLHLIAPSSGRYANTWRDLLIGLELIIQEKEIEFKLNQLLNE